MSIIPKKMKNKFDKPIRVKNHGVSIEASCPVKDIVNPIIKPEIQVTI